MCFELPVRYAPAWQLACSAFPVTGAPYVDRDYFLYMARQRCVLCLLAGSPCCSVTRTVVHLRHFDRKAVCSVYTSSRGGYCGSCLVAICVYEAEDEHSDILHPVRRLGSSIEGLAFAPNRDQRIWPGIRSTCQVCRSKAFAAIKNRPPPQIAEYIADSRWQNHFEARFVVAGLGSIADDIDLMLEQRYIITRPWYEVVYKQFLNRTQSAEPVIFNVLLRVFEDNANTLKPGFWLHPNDILPQGGRPSEFHPDNSLIPPLSVPRFQQTYVAAYEAFMDNELKKPMEALARYLQKDPHLFLPSMIPVHEVMSLLESGILPGPPIRVHFPHDKQSHQYLTHTLSTLEAVSPFTFWL